MALGLLNSMKFLSMFEDVSRLDDDQFEELQTVIVANLSNEQSEKLEKRLTQLIATLEDWRG